MNASSSSARVLPFTILTQPRDSWKVDRTFAERLREDAAIIHAKPADVIAIRNIALGYHIH